MDKVLPGALIVAVCWMLYNDLRHLHPIEHPAEQSTIVRAKSTLETESWECKPPYHRSTFPGSRKFDTVYGTIQVFEWGPEDGEKVLLIHGLATPCIALGDMATEFVDKGCRVMLFDLFGRGYSDSPGDLNHDARLYTFQILAVLSSSPLSWTGSAAFHLVGFSLGGSIAVAFAAYHASLLRSMTLVAPGGLIRTSHISHRAHFIYSSSLLPEWLRLRLMRSSIEPRHCNLSAENPYKAAQSGIDFDSVPISTSRPDVKVGDVIHWQLHSNPGFVQSYLSTVRTALVYGRHHDMWKALGNQLSPRKSRIAPPGLPGGRICLILAEEDVVIVKNELIEDMAKFLDMKDVDTHVLGGGHEIAVTQGKKVASIAMESWVQGDRRVAA